jgi:sortase A
MKRKVFGAVLICMGAILIVAALGISGYYLWVQERSGEKADKAMQSLIQQITVNNHPGNDPIAPSGPAPELLPPVVPDISGSEQLPDSQMRMPSIEIDGVSYIGYLEIPALELSLPVISESTKKNLDIAPCRFYGTVYQDNFVIGGHRYRRHFRKLSTLGYGQRLTFTDVEGTVFTYEVMECEVIEPYEAEYLCSGVWDLSLYTCTPGGASRVVVRCERVN